MARLVKINKAKKTQEIIKSKDTRFSHDVEVGVTIAVHVRNGLAYFTAAFTNALMGDQFSRSRGRLITAGRINKFMTSSPELPVVTREIREGETAGTIIKTTLQLVSNNALFFDKSAVDSVTLEKWYDRETQRLILENAFLS